LVGPSVTSNAGIIGEEVQLTLAHTAETRHSTILFHLTQKLVESHWKDKDEEPKLFLFGQLKRIAKQWLETCLECKGGTYPAQLLYNELKMMACNRITAAITTTMMEKNRVKAIIDPYNPAGSTRHVFFNTSKPDRWQTRADRSHVNWVVLDSDWEGEFCRLVENHPRVRAYVKNQNLAFEVPYQFGSVARKYLPDFIVRVEDGHGEQDLLNLIVEIKGYRREDAKEKKLTMDTYWIPGVNYNGNYGRWAFAEFGDVYQMESDFKAKLAEEFEKMLGSVLSVAATA
jgi:type III restriction enzyme